MKPRKRLRTVGAEVAGTWRGDACVAQERGSRQGTRATTRDNTFQMKRMIRGILEKRRDGRRGAMMILNKLSGRL